MQIREGSYGRALHEVIEARDYQQNDVDFYFESRKIGRRPIHCAPTGSGKTVCQSLIAKEEMDRGNSVAILTPRIEIFDQTHSMAEQVCGEGNVAILRSGKGHWNRYKPVHIVSWPTLISRVKKSEAWFPDVRTVLVDEAHLSTATKMMEVLERYAPRANVHGYTATPARQTGNGLGRYYTDIHHVTTVRRLIQAGYLASCEYWGGATPNLEGIKIKRGDYETKKLSKACVTLVGDVVDNYLRLGENRHAIYFAVDIAHCEMLAERFNRCGISAAALHVRKTPEQREAINRAFKAQEIQVLVNVSIASYGYDAPSVSLIGIARPTKSIVLHLQMIGRGMRPKENGSNCLVLDHAGNVRDLGQADDLFRWRLDEGKPACENWTRKEASGEADEAKVHECDECHHLFSRSRVCPKCGWEVPQSKRDVETVDADLVPIGRNMAKPLPEGWPNHEMFFRMLQWYAADKGYQPGWAFMKFKDRADVPADPAWAKLAGVPPVPRVKNWIISRNIAWAKRRKTG